MRLDILAFPDGNEVESRPNLLEQSGGIDGDSPPEFRRIDRFSQTERILEVVPVQVIHNGRLTCNEGVHFTGRRSQHKGLDIRVLHRNGNAQTLKLQNDRIGLFRPDTEPRQRLETADAR